LQFATFAQIVAPFNAMRRIAIAEQDYIVDHRLDGMTAWVRQFAGLERAIPVPASTDASFRRYFRVQGTTSLIVMDAPPPQENCQSFVQIAGYFESMGLNGPRILESDLDLGYLLLSDLGSAQYLSEIETQAHLAEPLYKDALDALILLQARGSEFQNRLPPYSEKLLRFELSLFRDWLCAQHLGLRFSDRDQRSWQSCCDALVECALAQTSVFVHRDFHSRNLMVTDSHNPGILDFQDAVEGPLTYDLVSLLKDCYIKWPAESTEKRVSYFYERSLLASRQTLVDFIHDLDLMGVQRHLKASGIFARLLHRDGKTGYLKDVPRTLSYIVDIASHYPELGFLGKVLSDRVLPALVEAD
jgi:N-acetylmuramate 1-kinase